jgi:predicted DNA-binding transcriptional regulator AlpA
MSGRIAALPLPFLRTPEAARFLGLTRKRLAKHRIRGTGPKYFKLGRCIVYAVAHLREWAEKDKGDRQQETVSLLPYLRTPEAAHLLGLGRRTLEKHRIYGTGPTYSKVGGRVIYAVGNLMEWVDRGARQSTRDPGHGAVLPPRPVNRGL